MAFNDSKQAGVQSVRRAFALITALAEKKVGVNLGELSREVGLNKSTAYQLLYTLQLEGLVEKEEKTHRYRLGPKVIEIAGAFFGSSDLIADANAVLREIRDQTGETTTLQLLVKHYRVTVAKAESPHSLRLNPNLGDIAPLVRGSGGKVMLAFMSAEKLKSLVVPAIAKGELKKNEMPALLKELRTIRRKGFALTRGEHVRGAFGISVPLLDRIGDVVGSLAIAGPMDRWTNSLVKNGIGILQRAASRVSPVPWNDGERRSPHPK